MWHVVHVVNFQTNVAPNYLTFAFRDPSCQRAPYMYLTPPSQRPHQLAPGETLATIGILQVGRTFSTLRYETAFQRTHQNVDHRTLSD